MPHKPYQSPVDSHGLIEECRERARLASREDRLYSQHLIKVLEQTLAHMVSRHNLLLEATGYRGTHEDIVTADGVQVDVVHREDGAADIYPVRLDKPIDHLLDIHCLDSILKEHDAHMLRRNGL